MALESSAFSPVLLSLGGLSVQLKGSPLALILLSIACLVWAYFAYRQTMPPSSIGLRLTLAFLRLAVLLLLIFLIFEPTVSWHRQRSLKPRAAVIVDDSESMKLKDASGERPEQLKKLFSNPAWTDLKRKFDLAYFAAGDSLRPMADLSVDSLRFRTIGSDLALAWEAMSKSGDQQDYAACVLVSDGGDNAGRDPIQAAHRAGVPIYTIGIGDTSPVRDAKIASLADRKTAYRGKPVQITVQLRAQGMENQPAHLDLLDREGKILTSRGLQLPPDDLQTEVTLEFTPDRVGDMPLQVRLTTPGDESSTNNNVRSLPLEVRESRIGTLLISGRPGYETMFLQQAATRLSDLNVEVWTFQDGSAVYGHQPADLVPTLAKTDVLILLDFPGAESPPSWMTELRNALDAHPLPMWFWTDAQSRFDDLQTLCGELPFKISKMRAITAAEAVPTGFYAELDPDAESEETSLWWDLPPLQPPPFAAHLSDNARSLIGLKDPDTGQDMGPALICWETAGRRLAASFGSGFWRWSFRSQGLTGSNELYDGLISKMLSWLAASPQIRPLHVTLDRKLYSSGENVNFTATVSAGDGRAITSAQVEVVLRGAQGESKLLLEPDPYGEYQGSFRPEGVGDYSYQGFAKMGTDTLGGDSGSFLVEAYNVEKETINQNWRLLEGISKASGGAYIPADSLSSLVAQIQAPPRVVLVGWTRRFFLNWDFWGLLIGLLGLEWLIRKRRGML